MHSLGYGVGSPLVLALLRIFQLLVLVYCGYQISYGKKKDYKRITWLAVSVYSVIEGLRWLRGVDYAHYYSDIVTLFGENTANGGILGSFVTKDPEILYNLWVTLFHYSHLPFWISFILYSAVLMYSVVKVAEHFPKSAVYTLPLFFIFTLDPSENLIRQYLAVSFILLAYHYYLKDNKQYMWGCLVISPLIHFSALVIDVVFCIFAYIPKWIKEKLRTKIALWFVMITFVLTFLFWDLSYLQTIADFISQNVDLGEGRGAGYISDSDRWLTANGSLSLIHGNSKIMVSSLSYTISKFLVYGAVLLFGFFAFRKNSQIFILYYFSYLCIIIGNISGDVELYVRFFNWFLPFMAIMAGVLLLYVKRNVRLSVLGIYGIYIFGYLFLATILGTTARSGYGFIWDAASYINIWFR